ncbi:hypothetical protein DIJ64_07520 [Mycobacterium leprae]|uniref:Uncharacterized protein n=1 Tax=Mycobacterium leprae TaxID=1769 RepID=A0AAD0KSN3_MYCLR|nr:hypothetical protein DIJ64_07520 [Mycobacterium leprae]OAR21291.1 hypothetical protein A8144_07160 [Mycobacterium leprae 3125609]OAX71316.1 hypothetical protein A3216_06330 [Mycobacterium leprae 7935681]
MKAITWVCAILLTIGHPRVVQRVGYVLVVLFQQPLEQDNPKPGSFTKKTFHRNHCRNRLLAETVECKDLEKKTFVISS